MPVYKCPACRQSDITFSHAPSVGMDASILNFTGELPDLDSPVRCNQCNWTGLFEELIVGRAEDVSSTAQLD